MYGNILIYHIVNRVSMFMVISNIDFSYLIYIYIYIYILDTFVEQFFESAQPNRSGKYAHYWHAQSFVFVFLLCRQHCLLTVTR